MENLRVSTVVHVPPEEAFEFLLDFPGYANYSEYLDEVRPEGDGGVGTRYDLMLSWWKLTYTARSRVTGIEPPERIDWELVGGLDAEGYWLVEPLDDRSGDDDRTDDAPGQQSEDDPGPSSRITLFVAYDPDSARDASLDLPLLASVEWVVEKAAPLAQREARRVVERVVADLEGERREVTLEVVTDSA